MNKINIAELLKDCPKGMELYSPIFEEVYLDKIIPHLAVVVTLGKEQGEIKEVFLYDGRYGINGGCMLFPSKGKTTWEGFHRPFKDGDVVAVTMIPEGTWIGIFKQSEKTGFESYCSLNTSGYFRNIGFKNHSLTGIRLATEEEKQKLFQAIKDNGYKWNAETKTLEKLPKFNVGDRVRNKNYKDYIYDIHDITDKGYRAKEIDADSPIIILFGSEEDNYELVPNKFDINTLKPYDKVLYRMHDKDTWRNSFYSFYKSNHHFVTSLTIVKQCIPYEGNEHLCGTTDDCNEYFKTWE